MGVFTKMIAYYKYKRSIKKARKYFNICAETYAENEKRIQEIKRLIEEDKNET